MFFYELRIYRKQFNHFSGILFDLTHIWKTFIIMWVYPDQGYHASDIISWSLSRAATQRAKRYIVFYFFIFTNLKLCLATASHNFKWVKIAHICLIWDQTLANFIV